MARFAANGMSCGLWACPVAYGHEHQVPCDGFLKVLPACLTMLPPRMRRMRPEATAEVAKVWDDLCENSGAAAVERRDHTHVRPEVVNLGRWTQ